jgi:hypothetical protein
MNRHGYASIAGLPKSSAHDIPLACSITRPFAIVGNMTLSTLSFPATTIFRAGAIQELLPEQNAMRTDLPQQADGETIDLYFQAL